MRTTAPSSGLTCVLAHEGEYWTLVFQGRVSRIRDVKGLHYLRQLLHHPGEEFHALALVYAVNPPGPANSGADLRSEVSTMARAGDAGSVLDGQAVAAYRRRFGELRAELADAEECGHSGRAAQAQDELEALAEQLAAGLGLGGRYRRSASPSERARLAVTKAIRAALRRIQAVDPVLGRHLERAVRTGTFCQYLPDPTINVVWSDRPPVAKRAVSQGRQTCRPRARARCRHLPG